MSGVANELFLKCQRHCEPLAFVMEEGDDVKRQIVRLGRGSSRTNDCKAIGGRAGGKVRPGYERDH